MARQKRMSHRQWETLKVQDFERLEEAIRSASLFVDHAIRMGNRLTDSPTFFDGISTTDAAWFGVLRGDLAEARDALDAAQLPAARTGEGRE